ncbi:MAG TPA: hypothetical protein VG318_06715 [Actinomycetota bacterium]|nr:hypothetical protein [Actinomycetota bacterium]
MTKLRRSIATVAAAAALAVPVLPATPAVAQTHDCKIMGGGNYVAEVVDCVYLVLSLIADPFPPR